MIVADGIYYALGLTAGGLLVSYLAHPWFGLPLYILAAFCLYFFRDPERAIPAGPVAVSREPATQTRVSIFMNIFDVHVNRAPIAGAIAEVRYSKGKFHVASREECSTENEQNVVSVRGEGTCVVFKQIAGLIARRIVFNKQPATWWRKGERVGLIKFGSRVDVLFGPEWEITVQQGVRVLAGSSVIARRPDSAGVDLAEARELVGVRDLVNAEA